MIKYTRNSNPGKYRSVYYSERETLPAGERASRCGDLEEQAIACRRNATLYNLQCFLIAQKYLMALLYCHDRE